ncbi:LacI family DNA-binding transcriptional regulator [Lapidilactobacillus luobeiensis]|uniref:LacI family DNA-binding transcriptional regulator n=1 Tax=Lapidilactobacillus luobeiensis TaxID=2950371 RepID=UPI0021C3CDD4|nr:LacI family DNA-binding transcriptional regulator [Lapidilactobacillus luobeiensis]
MAKITIKDVAREAGVSISTVSNTLNNVDVVREKTRAKVIAAAKKLDYTPNLLGKRLKKGSSKTIGLFTNSVKGPYFALLIDTLADYSEKLGYNTNVFISGDHDQVINNIRGNIVDGALIFNGTVLQEDLAVLDSESIPSVFLDRRIAGKYLTSVTFDSRQAGYRVADYLYQIGHRDFAYIYGFAGVYDSEQRLYGIQEALAQHHIRIAAADLIEGKFEEDASFQAVSEYIATHLRQQQALPTAFIAGNDNSAIGAIKAFKQFGIKVPADVSVTGFDDIYVSQYFDPPLTTINNPVEEQAFRSLKTLNQLMLGENVSIPSAELSGRLVIRESTKQLD